MVYHFKRAEGGNQNQIKSTNTSNPFPLDIVHPLQQRRRPAMSFWC